MARRKSSSTKPSAGPISERSPRGISEAAGGGSENVDVGVRRRLSGRGPPPGLPNVPATTSGPVLALPSASSWQSDDSTAENLMTMATGAAPLTSSDLVERDFRGKFVETQKKLTSSTNLAALGRMKKTGSVVRFADEIPQDWRKGKEKATLADDSMGPSRLRSSFASSALTDEENSSDDDNVRLPRTKSQLSLLIKQKRDETGSQDLGPEAKAQGRGGQDEGKNNDEGKGKGKGKGKENTKSKEEELLSMGRRGGVTKAGGVQVPKPQRLSEHDDPGHISSSSPEPLF
ncbi:hypothetical protein A1O3_07443 [Capronia epimyces CBS 606.96]|uniref:Uncharacterized protein n=1 Tax=Capronia epimyces CBS 606.96 TaxID=1182542 RepID=W9XLQ5_9EURO|nr:uncharacterized protein A1O3_07443 [Capronia epimyces CBS 606.96]EXJ81153.1 hypothetical protein A1O3_07443 [Capronia epimyces CBS 606.96]